MLRPKRLLNWASSKTLTESAPAPTVLTTDPVKSLRAAEHLT